MTSQINFAAIDAEYPVAGQDNDSQGFRDNFSAMQAALITAKTEITELQDKAVLKTVLDNGLAVDDPAFNNLNDNVIHTGSYFNFFPLQQPSEEDGTSTLYADVDTGDFFSFTNIAYNSIPATLSFRNWPSSAQVARVRVHLQKPEGSVSADRVITLATVGGNIVKTEDFPPVLTIKNNIPVVIEAWTYDGGNTVYVCQVGKFTTPTNNRNIVGNLTVEGDTDVVQLNAAALDVSGLTNLDDAVINSATITNDVTVNGNLIANGPTTLGNAASDKVTFVGIPKLPVMSTTTRNLLSGVEIGMTIFNETTSAIQTCTALGVLPGDSPTWEELLTSFPSLQTVTLTERNALTNVTVGRIILNTTSSKVQVCTGIGPVVWTDLN
jgi:hypothetical protein